MKNKILMLMFAMLLLLSVNVFAEDYQGNETINIVGEYKVNGAFSPASANITISLPTGEVDIDNQLMGSNTTGLFNYSYVIPLVDGEYGVVIDFYNVTNSTDLLGSVTKSFLVGDIPSVFDVDGELELFGCPTNHIQLGMIYGLFILAFVFYGIGLKFNNLIRPIALLLSGLMMIFLPFYIFGCNEVLAMFLWCIGLIMLSTTFILPFKTSNEEDDY